jgi:hypothetical protein
LIVDEEADEDKDSHLKSIALPTPHTVMDIDKFNIDTVF